VTLPIGVDCVHVIGYHALREFSAHQGCALSVIHYSSIRHN